jgi:hypothetical protein
VPTPILGGGWVTSLGPSLAADSIDPDTPDQKLLPQS